jgi:hypothetical protein
VLFSTKSDFGSFFLAAAVNLAIIEDSPRWKDVPEFQFRSSNRPWRSPETATTLDSVCFKGSAGWWHALPEEKSTTVISKLAFTASSQGKGAAWNVVMRISMEPSGKGSFQAAKLQRSVRTTVCSHSVKDMAAMRSIESTPY